MSERAGSALVRLKALNEAEVRQNWRQALEDVAVSYQLCNWSSLELAWTQNVSWITHLVHLVCIFKERLPELQQRSGATLAQPHTNY